MGEYPTAVSDLETWCVAPSPGTYALETTIGNGLAAHANVAARAEADRIVVFLPGAQDPKSQRRVPFFHRWAWQADLPGAHVIALGDPAIALDDRLRGGWFMHARYDLVADLASIVRQIADSLEVPHENVVFHGSSIGGYGAIAMASHLHGASALSEIPQIDVALWPFTGSQRLLEAHFGEPMSEFRKRHPERVNLLDRLRYANLVPAFTLITNLTDPTYDLQLAFIADVAALECESLGKQRLVVTDLVAGHKPLPKPVALEYLQGFIHECTSIRPTESNTAAT